MVAIFTGAGTGFERGSGNVLGGQGLLGSATLGRSGEQVTLNAANGNLLISQRDEFLVGRGPDAVINRTYNSLGDFSDDNGDNWRQGSDRQIFDLQGAYGSTGSTVKRRSGDGSVITYGWNGAAYVATDGAGAYDRITYDSSWKWQDGDSGITEIYAGPGNRISQMSDTNGAAITYAYSGTQLSDITTSNGDHIHYVWSGNNLAQIETVYNDGTISKQLTRTRYGYDGSGRLTSVTVDLTPGDNAVIDGKSYTTSYAYDGASTRVSSIIQTDGSAVYFAYDGANRVIGINQFVDGFPNRVTSIDYHAGYTDITDAQGQTTRLSYDAAGQLTHIIAPSGGIGQVAQNLSFQYNGNGDVTSTVTAKGEVTRYSYDGNGNMIAALDPRGSVTIRTYNAANQILTETRDGNRIHNSDMQDGTLEWIFGADTGNIHDGPPHYGNWLGKHYVEGNFSATAANQILSLATGDADWFAVAGGEHLFVQAGVEGFGPIAVQSLAVHWQDSSGNNISATTIGNLSDGQPFNSIISGFVDAPSGATRARLELYMSTTGAGSGRFIMIEPLVTGAAAGQTDAPAFGSVVAGAIAKTTRYVYDEAHNLRFVVDADGGVTEYQLGLYGRVDATRTFAGQIYDDIWSLAPGQQINYNTIVDWANSANKSRNQVLQNIYDNRLNVVQQISWGGSNADGTLTNANGYTHRYATYDQAGLLLSQTVGGQNTEYFTYDGLGRLIASTDIAGATTSIVFNDAATQTVVTLASGLTTTSTYDKAGELVATSESGAHMATGTSSYRYDTLGRLRGMTDANGLSFYYVYDKVGRKVAEVNQWGWMTEYRYDANDRLVGTVRYANLMSGYGWNQAASPNVSPDIANIRPLGDSSDIWSWTVYDASGRAVETIQGDGSVQRLEYDDADHLVRTTQFANKLTTGQVDGFKENAPSLLVLPGSSANDGMARTFYDRSGRVIGTLDGEGWLTRIVYDHAGQQIEETAFHNATAANLRIAGSFAQLVASVGASSNDAIVRHVYDGQGLLRYTIDGLNRVTAYGYEYDMPAGSAKWTAFGLVREVTHYAATIAPTDYTFETVRQAVAAIATNAGNRVDRSVYDAAGRLIYAIDANGGVVGYRYDSGGRVTRKVQFATPRATSYLPTEADMIGWEADNIFNGPSRFTYHYYNERGDLRFTVDPEGYVTRNDYDAGGRLTATAIWNGHAYAVDSWTIDTVADHVVGGDWASTSYWYDANDNVSRTSDGAGNIHDYLYYANGKLALDITSRDTGDDSRIVYAYDASGRLTRQIDAFDTDAQGTTSYAYDGRGNLVSITDPNGHTTTRAYDKAGQMIGQTDTTGATTSYQYDALGNQVRVTDARGNSTYDYYDKLGRVTATRDAENYVVETSYTVFGEVETVTKRMTAASNSANVDSLPIFQTSNADAVTQFVYDRLGRATTVTDAEGHSDKNWYDAFGNVIQTQNKIGGITRSTFDRRGLLITQIIASHAYDQSGNVLTNSTGGIVNSFEYDARGNRTKMIEASGLSEQRTTTYVYDKANRLTEKRGDAFLASNADWIGWTTVTPTETYAYDTRGNLIQTVDANGAKTLFYYDKNNRKIAEINAVGTLSQFSYDSVGNVVRSRVWGTAISPPTSAGDSVPGTPGGDFRDTVYAYDAVNRLTSSSIANVRTGAWIGGSTSSFMLAYGSVTTGYLYDAVGNLVRQTDGNGVTTFNYYDRLGRRVRAVDGEGYLTGWAYDAEGNVVYELRRASRSPSYDVNGAQDPGASADDRATGFSYDHNGCRIAETRYNVAAWTLDGNGGIVAGNGTSTITYGYNGLGEVTQKTEATGDTTYYDYDGDGRLTAERKPGFGVDEATKPMLLYYYNGLGNLVRTVQTAQGGGTERVTRYGYGAGGRLATMIDANGGATDYGYDAGGNLLRQNYNRQLSDGTPRYEGILYTRDILGRVTEQTVGQLNGSAWVKGDVQNSRYNAYGEVSQRGLNGGWQEHYDYDAMGQLWRSNGGDGSWRYFVHDGAGNRTLTLESDGTDLAGKSLENALGLANNNWATTPGATYIDGIAVTIAIYDHRNQQTATLLPKRQLSETGGVQDLWLYKSYTAFGEVASETSARVNTTTSYAYNSMGRLLSTTRPAVSITSESGAVSTLAPVDYLYVDRSGRTIGMQDANGHVTTRVLLAGTGYDGKDALVVLEYHADGGVITNGYDRFGDLRSVTDAIGHITQMGYDGMGQLTSVVRPGGGSEYYAYDILGQRIRHWNNVTGTSDVEATDYDQQGRIVRQRAYGNDVTTTSYSWQDGLDTPNLGAYGGWREVTTYANGLAATEDADMFGHTLYSYDLGVHQTRYAYDAAGRLVQSQQTLAGNVDETTSYAWLNTGRLGSMTRGFGSAADAAANMGHSYRLERTSYGYDVDGHKTAERYTDAEGGWEEQYDENGSGSVYVAHAATPQDASATYDAQGRLTEWSDAAHPWASLLYDYDAVGNVRRTRANWKALDGQGVAGPTVEQDHWYRYDAMDRVVTVKGSLVNGQIVRGTTGQDFAYNAAGERKVATRTVTLPATVLNPYYDPYEMHGTDEWKTASYAAEEREDYTYTDDGQIETVRVARSGYDDDGNGNAVATAPPSYGLLKGSYSYDGLGRLTRQIDYDGNGYDAAYDHSLTYNARGQVLFEVTIQRQGADMLKTRTTTDYGSGYGYGADPATRYALGAVVSTHSDNWKSVNGQWVAQASSETHNSYAWYAGAVLVQSTYRPDIAQGTIHTSSYTLGTSGQLTAVHVQDGRPRDIAFINDMAGQALRRDEADYQSGGDPHEVWYRFDGKQLGYSGNNGTGDTSYQVSIDTRATQQGTGAFRNGAATGSPWGEFDGQVTSITSYAQGVASGGGGSGGYTIRAGDSLSSIAAQLWGDAALWYKLAQANGMTADGALTQGRILNVPAGVQRSRFASDTWLPYDPAAAMGDTSPTTPAPQARGKAKKNKCGVFGQILLAVVAVAVAVIAAPAALASTSILQGALAGAAGSLASQGVGLITGIQDKFSFKGVALAALAGGVAAGLGGTTLLKGAGNIANAVARGVVGSLATQGIAVATGLQSKFDWAGVAAAGVSAGVGAKIGGSTRWERAGASFASGIAGAAATSLVTGRDFGDTIVSQLPSIIGNTIGNLVAGRINPAKSGAADDPKLAYAGVGSEDGVAGGDSGASMQPVAGFAGGGQVGGGASNRGNAPQVPQDNDIVVTAGKLEPQLETVGFSSSWGAYNERVFTQARWIEQNDPKKDKYNYSDWDARLAYDADHLIGVDRAASANLASFDRSIGYLGLAVVTGGLGGAATTGIIGYAGLTGWGAFGAGVMGDGLTAGVSGIPMRSALGQHNSVGTFIFDSTVGGGLGLVFRGGGAYINSLGTSAAEKTVGGETAHLPSGSFSVSDWSTYPAGVPRPQGPFRIIEGTEYQEAFAAKKVANRVYRSEHGIAGPSWEVHEIQPIKFGGSPTDPANKVVLSRDVHRQQVTPWWNQLQNDLQQ